MSFISGLIENVDEKILNLLVNYISQEEIEKNNVLT